MTKAKKLRELLTSDGIITAPVHMTHGRRGLSSTPDFLLCT